MVRVSRRVVSERVLKVWKKMGQYIDEGNGAKNNVLSMYDDAVTYRGQLGACTAWMQPSEKVHLNLE